MREFKSIQLDIIYWLIFAAPLVYLVLRSDFLPEQFIAYWNIKGEAILFVSPWVEIVFYVIINLVSFALFTWLSRNAGQKKTSLDRETLKTNEYERLQDMYVTLQVKAFQYSRLFIVIVTALLFTFSIFVSMGNHANLPVFAVGLAVLVLFVVFSGLSFYNRARIEISEEMRQLTGGLVDEDIIKPDSEWTFGIIYHNRANPNLWVRKSSGRGYTLNFGHALSYALVVTFLAIIIFIFTC